MTELDTRHRSSVYDSMVKSPNRAMLRATGMTDKDFETPIVGGFQLGRKIHHVTFTCMILGNWLKKVSNLRALGLFSLEPLP